MVTQKRYFSIPSTPQGVFFREKTLLETHLLPRPVIHKRRRRTGLEESTRRTNCCVVAQNGGRLGCTPAPFEAAPGCCFNGWGSSKRTRRLRSQKRILVATAEILITLSPCPKWRLWRLCLVGHFLDEQLVETGRHCGHNGAGPCSLSNLSMVDRASMVVAWNVRGMEERSTITACLMM